MDKDEKVSVMKKTYKKPDLYYENFALVEAIGSCDLKSNFSQAGGCVAYWDEDFLEWIFAGPEQGCTVETVKDDSICYGNPIQGFNIWSSEDHFLCGSLEIGASTFRNRAFSLPGKER